MTRRAVIPLLLAAANTLVGPGCGSPRNAQVLASITSLDMDGDGVVNDRDRCPDTPGAFALLGCPDSDSDGVADPEDQCPDAFEDMDGFEDGDGCVDEDHDHDGLPNREDECPTTPEDIDGLIDGDGCPEDDADGDGVPDAEDLCPRVVWSSCPIPDPNRPGCSDLCRPPPGPLMFSPAEFEHAAGNLRDPQKTRAEGVAQFMVEHARMLHRLRIVAHAAANEPNPMRLSRRRALSLARAFVRIGVAPERLELLACADHLPFTDNTDEERRELNRLVEFRVLAPAEHSNAVENPPGACQEVQLDP